MVSGRSTIPYSQGCTRHRPSKWVQPCGLVRRWRRDAAHGPSTSAAGFTMRCPTVRPASASSTTSQSGSGPCSMSTGSGGSCTSTFDAHHGDGVQAVFYEDPRVLTISLHEDGHYLFPGTGFTDEIGAGEGKGFAVNVPLPPYTRDVSYLYAFQAIVPPIARAFRPDVICSQLGADAHYLDPLTHLMLTTETYEAVGRILDGLSSELCGGRWIAVGGGGYDVTAVPRVWTVLFATMVGLSLDDALPGSWLREGNQLVGTVPAEKALRDHAKVDEDAHVPRQVKRTVEEIRRLVFPIHGIR